MQMVLKFLPNIVARLGKVNHVLDFGAGPTVHVAACFRHTAEKVALTHSGSALVYLRIHVVSAI